MCCLRILHFFALDVEEALAYPDLVVSEPVVDTQFPRVAQGSRIQAAESEQCRRLVGQAIPFASVECCKGGSIDEKAVRGEPQFAEASWTSSRAPFTSSTARPNGVSIVALLQVTPACLSRISQRQSVEDNWKRKKGDSSRPSAAAPEARLGESQHAEASANRKIDFIGDPAYQSLRGWTAGRASSRA